MKRQWKILPTLLCLLLLSACGGEETGTWTPVEDFTFSLEAAAGVGPDTELFDPGDFDPAVINDPDHTYNPKGWLDETTVLCTRYDSDSYTNNEMVAVTLDGQVSLLDVDIDTYTMVTPQNGVVVFGSYYENILDDVVTFARWNGDETLTPIHTFDEGIALGFQQFFSPDGTKAVMSWIPEDPGTDWNVRIIDLETGDYQDVTPPEIESEEPILLFSRWTGDSTLLITASDMLPDGYCAAWEYTLP
ncbi:MAG: hypothetical protein IKB65_06730 [Ruminiclostridium sp.]|nr:hypothetical protein [Ruminiclostridium sp.]